ncbi:hypothetical protein KQX54_007731 [Cotesia glomerata]|uniref:Uncharacterized protein n=1 Tax=Cotesia glomerata TaxID=32391 RepID=A0AAV7I256_COTGL|nr:hypothetical protein KQX54_007731 [Cotesia glomerata]
MKVEWEWEADTKGSLKFNGEIDLTISILHAYAIGNELDLAETHHFSELRATSFTKVSLSAAKPRTGINVQIFIWKLFFLDDLSIHSIGFRNNPVGNW